MDVLRKSWPTNQLAYIRAALSYQEQVTAQQNLKTFDCECERVCVCVYVRACVCVTEIDEKYMYIVQGEREREGERNVSRPSDIVHLHLHMQGHVYINGDCKEDIKKTM